VPNQDVAKPLKFVVLARRLQLNYVVTALSIIAAMNTNSLAFCQDIRSELDRLIDANEEKTHEVLTEQESKLDESLSKLLKKLTQQGKLDEALKVKDEKDRRVALSFKRKLEHFVTHRIVVWRNADDRNGKPVFSFRCLPDGTCSNSPPNGEGPPFDPWKWEIDDKNNLRISIPTGHWTFSLNANQATAQTILQQSTIRENRFIEFKAVP
jgi:hypothetical protein